MKCFIMYSTAETVFSQNDYIVRVEMNDIILRLDNNNPDHVKLVHLLLDNFFQMIDDDTLYEFMYTSTAEHRLKVRN